MYFALLSGSAVLILSLQSISAKRDGVIKVGTPISSTFTRPPSGTALKKCPDSHPFPHDHGRHCCQVHIKVNDTATAPDCDGGALSWVSGPECCYEGRAVECQDTERGCNTNFENDYPTAWGIVLAQLINAKWCYDDQAVNLDSCAMGESCNADPVIVHEHTVYNDWSGTRGSQFALVFHQCEFAEKSHWIAKHGTQNATFTVDVGCDVVVEAFHVRNTKDNGNHYLDTKDFTIEMSFDRSSWTEVVAGTLERATHLSKCEMPVVTFPTTGFGRYIRFTALSSYSRGGGLNYLGWTVKPFP